MRRLLNLEIMASALANKYESANETDHDGVFNP